MKNNFTNNPPIWFIAIVLIFGASCLGVSPLFVRISEVGPTATAFWRSAIAIPIIYLIIKYLHIESVDFKFNKKILFMAVPGIFLGIDHAAWHHGIMLTSVANATLFACMAPVFVVIYGWLFFSWKISFHFIICLILVILGSFLLFYDSLEFSKNKVIGDLWSLFAGACYAGYLLFTGILRDGKLNSYIILFYASLFSAIIIFVIFLFTKEQFFPETMFGLLVILGISIISQIIGIGSITWALGKVKTSLASLTLMSEPLTAALLGIFILGEFLSLIQISGGIIILIGILLAQNNSELKSN